MANYLITGGTGLIGRALISQLLVSSHQVTVLTRDINKARRVLPVEVNAIAHLGEFDPHQALDYVVNLAGEPIADKRWSRAQKLKLWQSRVVLTEQLVVWLKSLSTPPKALISGSAVGWYGDCGKQILTEQSPASAEYTHSLCRAWEAAANQLAETGVRVCTVRTGLVISPQGGFLAKMKRPFQLGLGARLGSGEQYMSWIHIEDMVRALLFLIDEKGALETPPMGTFNLTSPNPVTNRAFTRALAAQLKRPSCLVIPQFCLTTALGEMARLLITGQRVVPQRLLKQGFCFHYPTLDLALTAAMP